MNTPGPRIPVFAICARCAGKSALGPCYRCGLLMCKDCRGSGECVVCYREEQAAHERVERLRRWKQVGHQLGIAACVAATAMAGVGAALLPDPPRPPGAHEALAAHGQVRFIAQAVERFSERHGGSCPSSLGQLQADGYLLGEPVDPWGEPLLFGCIESPRSLVILSKGADHLAGTADDVALALP